MIYLSGPISGIADYLKRFCNAEHNLYMTQDDLVINPACVLNSLPIQALTYKDLMRLCLDLLAMCDSIYMLNGWEKSRGAKLEYQYAVAHDYNIYFQK